MQQAGQPLFSHLWQFFLTLILTLQSFYFYFMHFILSQNNSHSHDWFVVNDSFKISPKVSQFSSDDTHQIHLGCQIFIKHLKELINILNYIKTAQCASFCY